MKNKREKIILTIAFVFLASGVLLYKNRTLITEHMSNSPYLVETYRLNQSKKITKEIFRKVHDDKFRDIVSALPLEKQELISDIILNPAVSESLNNENTKNLKNPNTSQEISYEKALTLIELSKGLNELSQLSPQLKEYLDNKYPNFHYQEVATKEKDLPEIIKSKEKLLKLVTDNNLKDIIKNFPLEKIEVLNGLISGDNNMSFILDDFNNKEKQPQISMEYFSKQLKFDDMKKAYSVATKLTEMEKLDPALKAFLEDNLTSFDYKTINKYGSLYLSDKEKDKIMGDEYSERYYIFENPYVKFNPYGRTPLTALVKFQGENPETSVSVTITGKRDFTPLKYTVPNFKDGIPIIGLYPRDENTVTLKLLDAKSKKVLKTTVFKIVTPNLSDKMPVVIIEKKVASLMEPGMNLVSFNSGKESMPFIFDSNGNIRYIFSPSQSMGNIILERDKNNNWLGYGKDMLFTIDILGKILDTKPIAGTPFEVQHLQNGVILSNTQYLTKKNNYLTVFGYSDRSYPSALFQEIGCDSKNEFFRARIYYDGNSFDDNNIMRGERVSLIPKFNKMESNDGAE